MKAGQNLAIKHTGLAFSIARSYANTIPSLPYEDIASEAMLALVKASLAYAPLKGTPFEAYAAPAIRNRLNSLYGKEMIRTDKEKIILEEPLYENHGDEEGSETQKDTIPDSRVDPSRQTHRNQVIFDMNIGRSKLDDRQRYIIELLSEGETYSEIGLKLGISKQAAQQAAQRALKQMREDMENKGYFKGSIGFSPATRTNVNEKELSKIERIIGGILMLFWLACVVRIIMTYFQ